MRRDFLEAPFFPMPLLVLSISATSYFLPFHRRFIQYCEILMLFCYCEQAGRKSFNMFHDFTGAQVRNTGDVSGCEQVLPGASDACHIYSLDPSQHCECERATPMLIRGQPLPIMVLIGEQRASSICISFVSCFCILLPFVVKLVESNELF